MSTRLFTVLLLACSLTACDDGPGGSDPGPGGASDVAQADAADAPEDGGALDGGALDGGGDAALPDAWVPPPVAPEVEPEPLEVRAWLVGGLANPNEGDPVHDALMAGTFEMPENGPGEAGIHWRWVGPDEEGGVGDFQGGLIYAIAEVDAGQRIIARTDRTLEVWIDRELQPGDIYASRRMRVPLVAVPDSGAAPDKHLVVVRGIAGRGGIQVQLWTTPDELAFNFADVTFPDLRVGDTSEQHLGMPVLNLTGATVFDLRAQVVADEIFEATEITYPALPVGAATQIGFLLRRKVAPEAPEETVPVRLRLESPSLEWSYERTYELTTVAADVPFRRTFRSPIDHSIQYYGVQPPSSFDPDRRYGLVLSLHGAGVDAIGQARAYSPKDWTYIVAPTNRRPFGFDWEEWGHLNGLAAMDHAVESFNIDPTRTYVTGHSMGGHGTWQFGVHHPGRFAVVAPSAGWSSFYTYTGARRPQGPFARARAHSDTNTYVSNLARRGVYIIHGSADDNVPVREARDMFALVSEVSDDVVYHEEPGAGHWWDGDASEGADCVDWPPLFEFMQARTLDPFELVFDFRSPAAWYSSRHAYVRLDSSQSPNEDLELHSSLDDEGVLQLDTQNVRSMSIDGEALQALGVDSIVVDGEAHEVPEGPLLIGPGGGKTLQVQGPYNQVYHRPFCWVYADDKPVYRRYAAYMASEWAFIGNGHACALPYSALSEAIRADYNLIYLGLSSEQIGAPEVPFEWDESTISFRGMSWDDSALLFVFPQGDRLSALLTAVEGLEPLLWAVVPFSSRSGLPDYLIWSPSGGRATGFFGPDWDDNPAYGAP